MSIYTEPLKDHKRSVHRQEKVKCNFCDFSSLSRSAIYIHKQSKHFGRTYPCDQCDHVAEGRQKLLSHKGKTHRKTQEFPCKICTNIYKWKETLKRHMDMSHSGGTNTGFKCDICAKVYTQKVTLELHIKFVHNKEQVSCGQCDMKFSSRSSLLYHKKFKHEGRTFPCDICADKLSTKISLTNHIERKHKSNISEEKFFACNSCSWKTDSQAKLHKHAKHNHVSRRRIVCELCNKSLANSKTIASHLENHSKTATAYHNCPNCSFYSPNRANFEKHTKSAHNISSATCNLCKKSLANQQNLASHMKFHSKKRTAHHRCTKCFFHTASQFHLKRHVQEVHVVKKLIACLKCDVKIELIKDFHSHMKSIHPKKLKIAMKKKRIKSLRKCNICEYSSLLQKDIDIHKKTHTNIVKDNSKSTEKPDGVQHPCDKCTKSFTGRKPLKQHMKYHGNFPCMKCFKTFSLKSELLSLAHLCNNIKDKHCSLCGKSFRFKAELKRHIRSFHLKERLFKCKECPKAYTDPTPLRHHTNATHGDGSTFSNCAQCKKTFTTKRRYLEHTIKYH